jgi:hypothetical protein
MHNMLFIRAQHANIRNRRFSSPAGHLSRPNSYGATNKRKWVRETVPDSDLTPAPPHLLSNTIRGGVGEGGRAMEAIRKQASKFREQVARQQQVTTPSHDPPPRSIPPLPVRGFTPGSPRRGQSGDLPAIAGLIDRLLMPRVPLPRPSWSSSAAGTAGTACSRTRRRRSSTPSSRTSTSPRAPPRWVRWPSYILDRVSRPGIGSAYATPCIFISFQHFQRDIVRGVEGYIVTGSKQVEIGKHLNSHLLTTNYMQCAHTLNLNWHEWSVMRECAGGL